MDRVAGGGGKGGGGSLSTWDPQLSSMWRKESNCHRRVRWERVNGAEEIDLF